jgi:hypothetical protein
LNDEIKGKNMHLFSKKKQKKNIWPEQNNQNVLTEIWLRNLKETKILSKKKFVLDCFVF